MHASDQKRAPNDGGLRNEAPVTHHRLLGVAVLHAHELTRFFRRRTRSALAAEDLLQDLYLQLLKSQASPEIRHDKAYLFTIASNLAWQHRECVRKRPATISLDNLAASELIAARALGDPNSPETAALLTERLERASTCLEQLPIRVQKAILWHHMGGHTCLEVAEFLGVSVPSVKQYLMNGLAFCRPFAI